MEKGKKLLSLLLCLMMVLSFFPTAALAESEGNGVILEDERDHKGEDQGTIAPENEEPVGAIHESPEEETPEEPVGEGTLDVPEDEEPAEDANGELVRVEFVCDPEDTVITVYDPEQLDENGEPLVIDPEEDGTWLLAPGEYWYDAECEGFVSQEKNKLVVINEDGAASIQVAVALLLIKYCTDDQEMPGWAVGDHGRARDEINATSTVMTANEFIGYLNIALNRKTKYSNEFPYNVGYYDGTYIYWDCWNLGKTIIATRGSTVNNYTSGTKASAWYDTSIGLSDTDGDGLESACGNTLSSDFSNIVPGEWLFRDNSNGYCYHVGYYIGNGKVIEATSDGSYNVQVSTIDSSGHSNLRGSAWTWTYHGKVPWIDYSGSGSATHINKTYQSYLKVTATKETYVKTLPCSRETDSNSDDVTVLAKGDTFEVDKLILNDKGNYWYHGKTSAGKEGYVYSANFTVSNYRSNIGYSGKAFPSSLTVGKTYPVDWIINSRNLNLNTVDGYIYGGSNYGTVKYHGQLTGLNSASCSLGGTALDNALLFNKLDAGSYKMVITATATNYYCTDGKTLQSKTMSATPISFTFTEVSAGTQTYYLDLNGYLDGESVGSLGEYGTADVYINGSLDASGVSDYYKQWPAGTTYEIKNIQATSGHRYNGVYSGSLSGTIGSATVTVVLSYSTYVTPYLSLKSNSLALDTEEKPSETITIYYNGTIDYTITMGYNLSSDCVSATWGDWVDGGCLITLTAKQAGTCTATFRLINYDTDETVCTIDLYITVTSPTYSGQCGDNLIWTLENDGTLSITGFGDMWDFSYTTSPWYSHRENVKKVTLTSGATSVGQCAFYDCSNLLSVSLPTSVSSIGRYAFGGCSSLPSITIPNGVTTLGYGAFCRCSSLKSATIPSSVTSIGDWAFNQCTSLTSITIPSKVTSIGFCAFRECDNLTEINVSEQNNTYASQNGVLYNKAKTTLICCPGGKSGNLVIPSTVKTIYQYSIYRCTSLSAVVIPSSTTEIGENAFRECTGLTNIRFEGHPPSIDSSAFVYVTTTAYYPGSDSAWTENVCQNYGGTITWVPYATYTITYNANGGTGAPSAQTKTHDVVLTLSTTKPTRANASAGSYTVTLNANGGSVSTDKLTAARTTSYTFKNWNTAANGGGTSYNPGASYTANAAATLYAQWNSSTTTAAVTLPSPTRNGYSFQGWATSATATGGSTGNYTPTGNVTLYAIWKQDQTTEGTLSLGTARGSAGSEVVLEVKLDKNPGIMMLSFRLDYDKSKLQFLGGEDGNLTDWTFSPTGNGALWDGDKDYKATGTIVKLRFKILDNAKEGDVTVNLTAVEAWNYSEKEIRFGASAGKVTVSSRIPGDVTGDGKVNGMDGDSVEIDLSNADVTGDGKVNGMDLIRLRKFLAGDTVELK